MTTKTALWSMLLLILLAVTISACNDNRNRHADNATQPVATLPPPLFAEEGKIVFECRGEIEYRAALCLLDSTGVRWLTSDVPPGIVYGYSPRLSPDGQVIAFVSEHVGSVGNIYLINVDGSGLRRLTDMPGGAQYPAWSPDGTRIAFTGWSRSTTPGYEPRTHIFVIQSDGSNLVDVTGTGGGGSQPDWSPDGQRIAFTGGRGIAVINVDGTGWMDIIQFGYRDYFDRYFLMPRWSPDGRAIALASMRIDGEDYQLYLFNLEGGSMTRLTNLEDNTLCPTWTPDGNQIAFSSGGFIRRLDLESGNVTILASGACPDWGP